MPSVSATYSYSSTLGKLPQRYTGDPTRQIHYVPDQVLTPEGDDVRMVVVSDDGTELAYGELGFTLPGSETLTAEIELIVPGSSTFGNRRFGDVISDFSILGLSQDRFAQSLYLATTDARLRELGTRNSWRFRIPAGFIPEFGVPVSARIPDNGIVVENGIAWVARNLTSRFTSYQSRFAITSYDLSDTPDANGRIEDDISFTSANVPSMLGRTISSMAKFSTTFWFAVRRPNDTRMWLEAYDIVRRGGALTLVSRNWNVRLPAAGIRTGTSAYSLDGMWTDGLTVWTIRQIDTTIPDNDDFPAIQYHIEAYDASTGARVPALDKVLDDPDNGRIITRRAGDRQIRTELEGGLAGDGTNMYFAYRYDTFTLDDDGDLDFSTRTTEKYVVSSRIPQRNNEIGFAQGTELFFHMVYGGTTERTPTTTWYANGGTLSGGGATRTEEGTLEFTRDGVEWILPYLESPLTYAITTKTTAGPLQFDDQMEINVIPAPDPLPTLPLTPARPSLASEYGYGTSFFATVRRDTSDMLMLDTYGYNTSFTIPTVFTVSISGPSSI